MSVALDHVRARLRRRVIYCGRAAATFTVDARIRTRFDTTPSAHVQCLPRSLSVLSTRVRPSPTPRPPRFSLLPSLPRARLRHRRPSSRSRDRDVSADLLARVSPLAYTRRSITSRGEHDPGTTGRRPDLAGQKRAVRATERTSIETHGATKARARSLHVACCRVSLSLSLSASTFPHRRLRRVRSAALGRTRLRSASRRRARPNEQ